MQLKFTVIVVPVDSVCYSDAGRQWQGYVNRTIADNETVDSVLQRIGKEEAKKRLEKRLEKRENT